MICVCACSMRSTRSIISTRSRSRASTCSRAAAHCSSSGMLSALNRCVRSTARATRVPACASTRLKYGTIQYNRNTTTKIQYCSYDCLYWIGRYAIDCTRMLHSMPPLSASSCVSFPFVHLSFCWDLPLLSCRSARSSLSWPTHYTNVQWCKCDVNSRSAAQPAVRTGPRPQCAARRRT